jgi:hypothetical protein
MVHTQPTNPTDKTILTLSPHCPAGVSVRFKDGTLGGGLKWIPRECPYIVLKEQAHVIRFRCASAAPRCHCLSNVAPPTPTHPYVAHTLMLLMPPPPSLCSVSLCCR